MSDVKHKKIVKCPKCGSEMREVRNTTIDGLYRCPKCGTYQQVCEGFENE